ncbi:MAG: sigma-54-dependent Fis family transcriptional regulator [Desulfobacteraceae bacterium 4484_190.1]|nr:MAG: sigma-54-dependent Fis family transcriptional regulator [Desulfobacteraceae bacterium 4484_190.1]
MSTQQTILIVDDDLHILEVIEARLSSAGFQVLKASDAREGLKILKTGRVDLLISDMKMPGMSGMELLHKTSVFRPDLPFLFLTAYGTIPDAVSAVRAGAIDYLTKPFDGHDLINKIQSILKEKGPSMPDQGGTPSLTQDFYKGKNPAMKELYDLIKRVAKSDVSVLLLGESGVGKERVANLIHQLSPRRNQPFIVVDCGSTPSGLLESELFGHTKGAFTHAIRDKKGLIEASDQGTLFLDEIGNVSPEMQIRLLRFLEDRKIRRVGDLRERTIDCHVISATNTNLIEDIREGRFREDLYYRLRVVSLTIPPLRDRKEDIPFLGRHFIKTFCKNQGIPEVELLPETSAWLKKYPWPGNVRELKNAIEAGIVLCKNGILKPKDLCLAGLPEFPDSGAAEENPFSLEESERQTIIRALKESRGVQKSAAELLGISRRAIHYKIKKFGITPHKT